MEADVRTLHDTAAARILRAELMALATAIARHPGRTATLRLVRPRISEERLEKEWRGAADALRPTVLSRLSLQAVFPNGRSRAFGVSRGAPPEIKAFAERPLAGRVRLPARDLSFVVEKLLVWAWLTGKGPLTRKRLEQTAGCSYPTVASATRRLGRAISRRRDRRLELREFPRQEWSRALTLAEDARSTMRFADRAGQPRTASSLAERLQHLRPKGVAIGGVLGARHHDPELDLMGLPRLDVSVLSPGREADIAFVRRIDPALEATSDPAEPARLVVHFVRHREALFEANSGGLPWADPVECLLDLHEARLEPQAAQFVRAVRARGQEVR